MFKWIKMPKGADMVTLGAVYILIFFGLLMIASASMSFSASSLDDLSSVAKSQIMDLVFVVLKQGVFLFGGYLLMIFITRYFKVYYLSSPVFDLILWAMAGLLGITFFTGYVAGGARAWISISIPFIGGITIQPSEFAKILMVLLVAGKIAGIKADKDYKDILKVPVGFFVLYSVIIIFFQSDFGSFAVLFFITMICFMACSHRSLTKIQFRLLIVGIIGMALVFFLLHPIGTTFLSAFSDNYMIGRFLSAANPFIDPYGDGYQLIKGLTAFASGGLYGLGFGNSFQKYTEFPAAGTDYILAILVEELGFVGFLIVLICYVAIIYRFLIFAVRIKNQKAKVILIGMAMYFFIHFVFNVGGVSGLIPLTGVPLLLISSGGSSTVAAMIAIGFGQSIIYRYRQGKIE